MFIVFPASLHWLPAVFLIFYVFSFFRASVHTDSASAALEIDSRLCRGYLFRQAELAVDLVKTPTRFSPWLWWKWISPTGIGKGPFVLCSFMFRKLAKRSASMRSNLAFGRNWFSKHEHEWLIGGLTWLKLCFRADLIPRFHSHYRTPELMDNGKSVGNSSQPPLPTVMEQLPSYLGKRISLVSKRDIRYEGILQAVEESTATVAIGRGECANIYIFFLSASNGNEAFRCTSSVTAFGPFLYSYTNCSQSINQSINVMHCCGLAPINQTINRTSE